jgi:shikimate dehydrogenase
MVAAGRMSDDQAAAAATVPSGRARVAGIIGWPVAHSLSPRLHGFWLHRYELDGAYVPMAVRPGRLREALAALAVLGFAGANVTIPHKEDAFSTVDEVADIAKRIGAVNTVIVDPDGRGRVIGTNTDAFGFSENLKQSCPGWIAGTGPAVILGAGGAARAVAVALLDAGVRELRLINRDAARAERLAATLAGEASVRVWSWREREAALADAGLLVNATSLGMAGHPELELDLAALPTVAVVADVVYVPLRTRLLERAAAAGHRIVDGLGMLMHQARPAFHLWYGMDPEVTPALRRHLERGLTEP